LLKGKELLKGKGQKCWREKNCWRENAKGGVDRKSALRTLTWASESKAEKELHTEALGKLKPKKSQIEHRTVHSARLRTETLRVMHIQVVGSAVCKSEHPSFERAKGRWDSASWGRKALRTIKLKIS
jgi:hypothetical protein